MSGGKLNLVENMQGPISREDMEKLLNLLDSIQFGSVTLIIQNGKVVQIEKNEKMRLK